MQYYLFLNTFVDNEFLETSSGNPSGSTANVMLWDQTSGKINFINNYFLLYILSNKIYSNRI